MVDHDFKAIDIWKDIDVFVKDFISLTCIL
jgi:hypothetical protein